MEAASHSDLNFVLKIDSATVGKGTVCAHKIDSVTVGKVHSMCAHHVLLVTKALCMTVAVDYSVANRFLPEPC